MDACEPVSGTRGLEHATREEEDEAEDEEEEGEEERWRKEGERRGGVGDGPDTGYLVATAHSRNKSARSNQRFVRLAWCWWVSPGLVNAVVVPGWTEPSRAEPSQAGRRPVSILRHPPESLLYPSYPR